MERKLFEKRGIALVLAVLLLAAGLWLLRSTGPSGHLTAVVTIDGKTVLQIDLSEAVKQKDYTLENGIVLRVQDHTIRFLRSDCPDKTCVKCGALRKNGELAACVPNGTVLVVKGSKAPDADVVTY